MNTIILIADCSLTAGLLATLARLEEKQTQLVLFEIKTSLSSEPSLQDALADIAKSLNNFLTSCKKSVSLVALKVQNATSMLQNTRKNDGHRTAITETNDMNKSRGPP